MQFKLYTLVDITETHARRGEGNAYKQQQNYMTVLQTVGLRSNPSNVSVTKEKMPVSKLGFGNKFKGQQNVWVFKFDIEYEAGHSIELLTTDFDMVPFISNLEETVDFEKTIFYTKDSTLTNIVFEELDK
jgi:hypothetical protein